MIVDMEKKSIPPDLEGFSGRLRPRFQRPRIPEIFENRTKNQHFELFKKCVNSVKMKFLVLFSTFLKKSENFSFFRPNRVSFSDSLRFQKIFFVFSHLTDRLKVEKIQIFFSFYRVC